MWIFYYLLWTAVRASAEEPLYRKIGDEVVLTPDSVENPITNIRWKHDDNIAMQWYGDETSSYRQFKDRGSLNISTGVITITGLTRDLSGIYTAEINGKETSKTQLHVISPVPKPNLTVSCERTYCIFTCSGSITDAEPVTYWWTAGEKRWNSTDKQHRITKEEEEQWFSCTLKNPISSNSSEKVFNPFMEIISDKTSRLTSPAIGVPLAVCSIIIIIIIIIIIYLGYKYRKAAADLRSLKPQWQYKGDKSGDWCDFIETSKCSVTSDVIEEQYQKNPNGKMLLAGEEYELDFKEMTKTNLRTKAKRKIRCVLLPAASPPAVEETSSQNTSSAPVTSNEIEMALMLPAVQEPTSGVTRSNSNTAVVISRAVRFTSNQNQTSVTTHSNSNTAGFKPQWEFERSGGGWHDFRKKRGPLNECSVTNDDIQKWYQEKPHVKMPLTVDGKPFELDFKKMILINLEDTTESNIRFVLVLPPRFIKVVSAAFPLKGHSNRDTVDGTEQEREEMSPAVQESSNQHSTSAVTYSNSNRAVVISTVHETSDHDLETFVAPDPRNDTEEPASPPAVEETSTQNTTSAPETSNETE